MERQHHYPAGLMQACGDIAFRDDLTGLLNRRLLNALFTRWWHEAVADCRHLSLIMIDLDGFKEVNDTFGHPVGDVVLQATAEVLRSHFRSDDLLVRYGGDEFLVVLPDAGRGEAGGLADRARQAMAALGDMPTVRSAGMTRPVSFSVGTATWPEDGETGELVLAAADRRLLADKRRRRRAWWGAVGSPRRAVAVGGVVLLAVAAALWLGRPPVSEEMPQTPEERDEPVVDTEEDSMTWRETALLEQISRLRTELDRVARRPVDSGEAASQAQQLETLRTTISRLESELEDRLQQVPGRMPDAQPLGGAVPAAETTPPDRPAVSTVDVLPVVSGDSSARAPVVVLPVMQRVPPARYPETALRLRRETQVELIVVVNEQGRVVLAEVFGPPAGFGFDEAAREAALGAEFIPGSRDGIPMAMEAKLTVQFRLDRVR